jgi:hypothetical protein
MTLLTAINSVAAFGLAPISQPTFDRSGPNHKSWDHKSWKLPTGRSAKAPDWIVCDLITNFLEMRRGAFHYSEIGRLDFDSEASGNTGCDPLIDVFLASNFGVAGPGAVAHGRDE